MQPGLYEKYKGEPSETSSMTEGEMRRVLEAQGIKPEETKLEGAQKVDVMKALVSRVLPPLPKAEDMAKARTTPDYPDFLKKFEDDYGKGKPKQRDVDDMSRKLDSRYKVMQDHATEVGRSDTDMQLYKNKIMKDLGDVVNDLREANNIITILMNDRNVLKDLFAIFNIQIKGLATLNKSLEEDLANRDKTIEKMKSQIEFLQAEIEKNKGIVEASKKAVAEMKTENAVLKRQASDAKAEAAKMKRQFDQQVEEIERVKKEVERLKEQLKQKTDDLDRLRPEVAQLRELQKTLTINNDVLKEDNARLKKENEELKVNRHY